MKVQGVLYTVEGPRGVYYAIYDPSTGRVWTERTESAAIAQAREIGILIVADEIITADELVRRTGRDVPERTPLLDGSTGVQASQIPAREHREVPLRSPEADLDVLPPPMPGPASDEPIVASRLDVGGSLFAADLPIGKLSGDSPFEDLPPPPPLEGFATLHGDLLDPTRRDV